MADQAVSSLSAGIFMDDVRSSIGGISNYTPVSGDDDAWAFAEVAVGNGAATAILDTSDFNELMLDSSEPTRLVDTNTIL